MNTSRWDEKFLDYIEDRLSPNEKVEFESQIGRDHDLKSSFDAYLSVMHLENRVRDIEAEVHPSFSVKVMESLEREEVGFLRRLTMHLSKVQLVRGAATVLLIVIAVQVVAREGQLVSREGQFVSREEATLYNDVRIDGPIPKDAKSEDVHGTQRVEKAQKSLEPLASTAPIQSAQVIGESDALKAKELHAPAMPMPVSEAKTDLVENSRFAVGAGAPMQELVAPSRGVIVDYFQPQFENTERYGTYEENRWLSPKEKPLSTFSIDVDTGSYSNLRRFITGGVLPPIDAVRIEEMLNYFDYQYPRETEKPFGVSFETAPSPLEPDRLLLKVGIAGKQAPKSTAGWNLVFLVDVSGSMQSPDKLELVKKGLQLLTQSMRPSDKIALVTYAGEAGVALESTPGTDKAKIARAIEGLAAGGSTNGSGGIQAAYDVAEKNRIDGGVNRVVLCTDGDFNVGITSQDELIRLIERKREGGVTLTTLGFGQGNIQEATMEQLADHGNGNYFYIDSFREARKVLETDLVSNMEVVAKDVKLQMEFNPEQVSEYRLVGYENRRLKDRDFNDDKIDAGEVGSGHTVTALYEVVLKGSKRGAMGEIPLRFQPTPESKTEELRPTSGEFAFLKIRYKTPEGSVSSLLEFPIRTESIKAKAEDTSDDFRFAAAVSYFGHLLRKSEFAGNYTLDQIVQLARGAQGKDEEGYRQDFVRLVQDTASISRVSRATE